MLTRFKKRKIDEEQRVFASQWAKMKITLIEIVNGQSGQKIPLVVPYDNAVDAMTAVKNHALPMIPPAFRNSLRIWFQGTDLRPNIPMNQIVSDDTFCYPISVCYSTYLPWPRIVPKLSQCLILLDVDGVINCLSSKPHDDVCESTFFSGRYRDDLPLRWSPWVVEQIKRWATIAEIQWATSWDKNAQYILAPKLGLPHFDLFAPNQKFWPELPEQFASYRILWIDDEFYWNNTVDSYRAHCRSLDCVKVNEGLTREDVALVDRILDRWLHES